MNRKGNSRKEGVFEEKRESIKHVSLQPQSLIKTSQNTFDYQN